MSAKNFIVVGGSYVGFSLAQSLAAASPNSLRVLLIEKNSHFQHLFVFPRYAVTKSVPTQKAFIPYTATELSERGLIIQAEVTGLTKTAVQLDRRVLIDGEYTDNIPYWGLALATGINRNPPSTLPVSDKAQGTSYLWRHAEVVERSDKIVIVGAGAVGVQLATDIKQLYPNKSVTLVHSRDKLMNKFHPALHAITEKRCQELGVDMVLGQRVKLPLSGYPTDGTRFTVQLESGNEIPADLAILCNGQTPRSELLRTSSPNCVNPEGFIKVKDTLQIDDEQFPTVFAVGDVAATAAHKAVKPAVRQAHIVAKNIGHILRQEPLENYMATDPAEIHLTLGIEKSVMFRNPTQGATEATLLHRDDGTLDMNIDGVWKRMGAHTRDAAS